MKSKICNKCNKMLPLTDFYKNRRNKDGLQYMCKKCCSNAGKKFRKERPEYYSYQTGYFSNKKSREYIVNYTKANKGGTIYKITTPEGIYIGATRTFLNVRMARHLSDFSRIFINKSTHPLERSRIIPNLHEVMGKYPFDVVRTWFKPENVEVLEYSPKIKTRKHLMDRETYWIQKLYDEGLKLLNIYKIKK